VNRVRIAIAVVALAAAVLVALLAADLRSTQDALRSGDAVFAQSPAAAGWQASTILPSSISRGLLGISDQLAFRRAAQSFVAVHNAGLGIDNGYSESQRRAALEVTLTNLAHGSDRRRAAAADNLLGILAFSDSQQTGASAPAPVERSVADFQSAVQLDPANADSKFNLEWLLRQLVATGTRVGNGGQGPIAKGHKGAGGGSPGKGY
jgi:hypothetical protein